MRSGRLIWPSADPVASPAKQRHRPAVNLSKSLPTVAMAGLGLLFLLMRVYAHDAHATKTTRAVSYADTLRMFD